MNGISSLYTSRSAPESFVNSTYPSNPIVSHVNNHSESPPPVPEDDGTIRCICGFADDDGLTVICEKCNTWQHVSCYYHHVGGTVPEEHLCADCSANNSPTPAAIHWAQERQRRRREGGAQSEEKKVPRPASKSLKKKQKEPSPNGTEHHERHISLLNGRDHPPPAKKMKTNHRPSASLASMNGESRKRAFSNVQSYPSPSKSPQELYRSPIIPRYTDEFLSLYENDNGDTNAVSNELTIPGSQALSRWRSDPQLLATEADLAANVSNASSRPFVKISTDVDEPTWPEISVETVKAQDADENGKPILKFVRLKNKVKKHDIVGEVRGQVGTLHEYCTHLTNTNRWKELGHPDPFVFFHPNMDVFIDSRRSGTRFRYIRRSCKNNVTIKTYITPEEEVRHLFVASRDIAADEELTATWYLPPHLFHQSETSDAETSQQNDRDRSDYMSRVLANFGGCACRTNSCLLARFDRRCSVDISDIPQKTNGKRSKKSKPRQIMSPTNNGDAGNSRAGSEAVKAVDEEEDHKSTSGASSRDAVSRDHTPQGGLLDADPLLSGLTAREMKKIQQLEKITAQKAEKAEKAEKAKTKKRPSGVSMPNTPMSVNGPSSFNTPALATGKHPSYTSTPEPSNRNGSPLPAKKVQQTQSTGPNQIKKVLRPIYVDAAMQTETETAEPIRLSWRRRKFETPTQRLLKKLVQHHQQHKEAIAKKSPLMSKASSTVDEDVQMKDAVTSFSTSPSTSSAPDQSLMTCMTDAKINETSKNDSFEEHVFKTPAPRLHLDVMPPPPNFTSLNTSTPVTTPIIMTPTATPGILLRRPSVPGSHPASTSAAVQPTPVKKKLSLGDYMKRKESATPSTEQPPTLTCQETTEKSELPADRMSPSIDAPDVPPGNLGISTLTEVEKSAIPSIVPAQEEMDFESVKSPQTLKSEPSTVYNVVPGMVSPQSAEVNEVLKKLLAMQASGHQPDMIN